MKFIISAYRAEAELFLNFADFASDKSIHEFQVFRSGHAVLGISGEGKRQAEKLTELLVSRYVLEPGRESSRWFNFGVAGSGSHMPGSLVYANQVIDTETENRWELPPRDPGDVSVATLKTVPKPSREYQEGVIYDMEASGILGVLSRHSLTRQACFLKLISDGPAYPFHRVAKADILRLLNDAEQKLHPIIQAWQQGE